MPRRDGEIERIDKNTGEAETLPSDYQVGKMQRGRKKRKGFRRRGRDGRMHTVEPHYQRYWYGGHNFGARPVIKDVNQPSQGFTPRSARKRYMTTSTLRQRQLDNKQKADQKREPIFGRDEGGALLLDPNTPGGVAIHDDEWWLWVSQPNQYDVAKVDEPLPEGMHFEIINRTTGEKQKGTSISDFDLNPYLYSQSVVISLHEGNREVGDIELSLGSGEEKGRDIIRRSKANRLGISRYEFEDVPGKPHLVSVPIYDGWTASPSLGVHRNEDKGKGYATFIIREAFDMGDRHNMRADVSAVPRDAGITDPVEQKAVAFNLRNMYTSFGLKADRTVEEIARDPEEGVHMDGLPYSQRHGKIIRGRVFEDADGEITAIHIDPSVHPETAKYNAVPRKPLEPRPYETTGVNESRTYDGTKTTTKKTIQVTRRP